MSEICCKLTLGACGRVTGDTRVGHSSITAGGASLSCSLYVAGCSRYSITMFLKLIGIKVYSAFKKRSGGGLGFYRPLLADGSL